MSKTKYIATHPHILGTNGIAKSVFFPNGKRIPPNAMCALELSIFSKDIFNLLENANDNDRLCKIFVKNPIIKQKKLLYFDTKKAWIHIEVPNDLKNANEQIDNVLTPNNSL